MASQADPACPECGAPVGADGICGICLSRDTALIDPEATHPPSADGVDLPDAIGSYRILRVLGEGGMGIVYLAEQAVPFRRQVALKVIKIGMNTHEVVARFQAERQALALMNHSHIAQIYGAGATDDGRPYFVMEHVAGVPITDYCDRNELSTRARLELFVLVCGAFEHAHEKGIIHRDVKPQNILVTVQDGRPVPKVIDFGVAKATRHRLTEKTIFTHLGLLIGTPAYMSPEQAELGGVDVTTATDIYSLGVLLYELLVSALPFDPAALRRAGYGEIQRIIREEAPPPPSTRLSGLGANAVSIAAQRKTDVSALVREIRGDLDWIVLKALEKSPSSRYSSASELAADVSRYLQSERVLARPSSFRSRLRRTVRQHPVRARVAAAVSVLVLALLAGAMWRLTTTSAVSLIVMKPAGGTVIGGGLVCGTHGTTCSVKRTTGDTVELYAVADPGYVLAGFSGGCSPAGKMLITEATACAVTFRKVESTPSRVTRALTITKPTGGTIVSANGILCGTLGSLCATSLDQGLLVTLRAVPDPDHRFLQFTGACAAAGETTMSEDRTCGAAFSLSANQADSTGRVRERAAPQAALPIAPLPETLRVAARPSEPEEDRASREQTAKTQLEEGRRALGDRQFDAAITALQSAITTSGRSDYGVHPNEAAAMLQQARRDKAAEAATLRQVAAQRSLGEAKALLGSDVIVAAQKLRIAKTLDPEIEGYLELLNAVSDRAKSLGEAALTDAKHADLSRNNVLAISEYQKAIQLLELIPGGHKDLHAARQRLAELKVPQ